MLGRTEKIAGLWFASGRMEGGGEGKYPGWQYGCSIFLVSSWVSLVCLRYFVITVSAYNFSLNELLTNKVCGLHQRRTLHKKWSFPSRVSSVIATRSVVPYRFDYIYCRNTKWKTSFFMQWYLGLCQKLWLRLKKLQSLKLCSYTAALKNVISSKEPNDWSYANSFSKFCVQS